MILSLLRCEAPESSEVASLCEKYGAPDYTRFTAKPGEKCILCGLCVQACESLGTGAISTAGRGIEKTVTTPYDEPSMVCVGCTSCAKVCPTGAIAVEESDGKRSIWGKEQVIKKCKRCGRPIGTFAEIWRMVKKSGGEAPDLCEECRKKSITDVMAAAYGVAAKR